MLAGVEGKFALEAIFHTHCLFAFSNFESIPEKHVGTGKINSNGHESPRSHFRYIKPTASHPEIRARFTPGAGLVFGPRAGDSQVNDDVSSRAHQAVRGLRRVPGDTRMTVEMAGLFVWLQSLRQGVLDKRGHFGARVSGARKIRS